jgi:hypothetical protein
MAAVQFGRDTYVIAFTATMRLRLHRLLVLTRNAAVSEKLPQQQGDSEYLQIDGEENEIEEYFNYVRLRYAINY